MEVVNVRGKYGITFHLLQVLGYSDNFQDFVYKEISHQTKTQYQYGQER